MWRKTVLVSSWTLQIQICNRVPCVLLGVYGHFIVRSQGTCHTRSNNTYIVPLVSRRADESCPGQFASILVLSSLACRAVCSEMFRMSLEFCAHRVPRPPRFRRATQSEPTSPNSAPIDDIMLCFEAGLKAVCDTYKYHTITCDWMHSADTANFRLRHCNRPVTHYLSTCPIQS